MKNSPSVLIAFSNTLQVVAFKHLLKSRLPDSDIHQIQNNNTPNFKQFDYLFFDCHTYKQFQDSLASFHKQTCIIDSQPPTHISVCFINNGLSLSEITEAIFHFINKLSGKQLVEFTKELSARELEVLQLMSKGLINKEIADKLHISINTVLTHRKNISLKLGIKTVGGQISYALMHGLVTFENH